MEKRLQRSRTERMIAGVCGGLAAYFKVDPTLVRAALAVVTVFGGAGVIAYVVLWAIMPLEPPPPVVSGYQPPPPPPAPGPPPGQSY